MRAPAAARVAAIALKLSSAAALSDRVLLPRRDAASVSSAAVNARVHGEVPSLPSDASTDADIRAANAAVCGRRCSTLSCTPVANTLRSKPPSKG